MDLRLDEMEQAAETLVESAAEEPALDQLKLQPGQTPNLYLCATPLHSRICDYCQTDYFEWLIRYDPLFSGNRLATWKDLFLGFDPVAWRIIVTMTFPNSSLSWSRLTVSMLAASTRSARTSSRRQHGYSSKYGMKD